MAFVNASEVILGEDVLQADYAAAEVLWKVRVGDQCVYFPKLLKTAYIPLPALTRAFLRVESVLSRVCCGPAEFFVYRLILCVGDTEAAAVELDSDVKGERILAALQRHGVSIGKPGTAAAAPDPVGETKTL